MIYGEETYILTVTFRAEHLSLTPVIVLPLFSGCNAIILHALLYTEPDDCPAKPTLVYQA